MHADLVNYRSIRCDRIARNGEDETTIRPRPSSRCNLFRSAWPPGWYRMFRRSLASVSPPRGCRVDTFPFGPNGLHYALRLPELPLLAVSAARIALPNFDNVAIGIAD